MGTYLGVGLMDGVSTINGKKTPEYIAWSGMLDRCYSGRKKFEITYAGCTVHDRWKTFSKFQSDVESMYGYDVGGGWELDKDSLVKGNTVYSRHTCLLVPRHINVLFTNAQKVRGEYLIGVSYEKSRGKFKASCSYHEKVKNLGRYDTEIEAFNAYKIFKESYCKELAKIYKSDIDPRLFDILMTYQVLEED